MRPIIRLRRTLRHGALQARGGRASACCALLVLLAGLAGAQDKPTESLAPVNDQQREMIELFGKVETRLREIDRLLSDAGAGDVRALEAVGPAGIDDLLKQSKSSGEQALQDIDKILELARQMGQQQSSGSGSGDKSQPGGGQQQDPGEGDGSGTPLDKQGGNTSPRESTPSTPEQGGQDPKDKPGGSKPDGEKGGASSQKDGDKPKEDGSPKGTKASPADPKNRESGAPPSGAQSGAATPSAAKDRWGDLPVHARDVFRNEGGRDMPAQYRDWIDGYYRRLNKKVP